MELEIRFPPLFEKNPWDVWTASASLVLMDRLQIGWGEAPLSFIWQRFHFIVRLVRAGGSCWIFIREQNKMFLYFNWNIFPKNGRQPEQKRSEHNTIESSSEARQCPLFLVVIIWQNYCSTVLSTEQLGTGASGHCLYICLCSSNQAWEPIQFRNILLSSGVR